MALRLLQPISEQRWENTKMTEDHQSRSDPSHARGVKTLDDPFRGSTHVVFTRDHDNIRRWAEQRQAEPATGQATVSGPATHHINDGGAGIRFNFPGAGAFRPISWDEWFQNFDHHSCAFVYDSNSSRPLSSQYRIVKADDWKGVLS
jgi:hypothetical protein